MITRVLLVTTHYIANNRLLSTNETASSSTCYSRLNKLKTFILYYKRLIHFKMKVLIISQLHCHSPDDAIKLRHTIVTV